MRYRVQAAERPDALYAVWQGRVFQAQRSTADGTMLLVVPPGEEPAEGFDLEWDSRPAKVVPAAEPSATFSLQTHCYFDDEIYRVAPQATGGPLTLRWTGRDETRARQLGLTDFSITAGPDGITALWQQRHDFAEPDTPRPAPGSTEQGDQSTLLRELGRTLRRIQPDGWQRVGAQFRQVGDYSELEVRSVAEDQVTSLSAPPRLGQLFTLLRSAMYRPGTGTWFQGTFTLNADATFDFDFDVDAEPNWRLPPNEDGRPTERAFGAELAYFPRDRRHVPTWLAAKAGLPLDVAFRQAKVADGPPEAENGRPVVNRPPVPPEELRGVLDYLYRSPVALARPGRLPDLFTPNVKPDVPDAFHTDGVWIWPAAVPHYLRKYGVPPEAELVEHIRANAFRPPYVGERLRATAEAELLGKPFPAQSKEDIPETDPVTLVDRGGQPRTGLRASEVLTVLQRRLTEYGVPMSAYRIGEEADGVWSLRRTEHSWAVSGPDGAEQADFAHVEEAARFLLGTLLLYPGRATNGSETEAAEQPPDWPVLPLRGEPPLNFYRSKRMVMLPAGAIVLRFGNEAGNLVHDESTRFPETSLAAEREQQRARYRLARPLRVLTGVTLPWGALPGGAVAYLLPRPIGHHLETGALERS
ncbi:TNT domain-containing protein [Amycolatopsis nigrescens]|uniref:TNT domain-containing protein n=1 Tax=Amycolatopsis nigrescens TaxID=381445 RepID=UPI00039BDFD4|nr:TNT domain-containing protein [Amycolatopsis nigrescens]